MKSISSIDLRAEYESVYSDYYERLCAYAFRRLKDEEEAKEIVLDLFADLWEDLGLLTRCENIKAYLFRAVHHRSLNRIERLGVRKRYRDWFSVTADRSRRYVDDQVQYAELEREMTTALDALPDKCRQVFELGKLSGLKYREIADIMGISPKTVENQMTKALKSVRGSLRGAGIELTGLVLWLAVEALRYTEGIFVS
ncbi:DNA-directed RNA polymerase sigma-70 factor [Fulvitalea axinellae]|uniref:DNA-directed RNA polymerase sigma-70 factor n=1 Tax=Fulvitalea axinellae TaxID=1182444 RepID=A0AAU9C6G5_9BACT|nr:DNA-directed RNA polymerase sigma-70 factor [Fulvitalea axinellae]